MQDSQAVQFNDPQLFINRELSWLAFNERVLDDARDRELPLYERLKFFAIASSNLDEFFMVRVAGLKQQLASGVAETAADGMLPAEQLSAISERVHRLVDSASRLWVEELQPGLTAAGVSVLTRDKLTAEQKAAARTWFTTSVFPALTPLAVDPGHPFPHLRNKSLNVAVLLRREGPKRRRNARSSSLAVVQVPSVLRQLVPMPVDKGLAFLLLGEVIALCAADLFPGYVVEHTTAFRVTRNWDLNVDDEESEDLLSTIQDELRRRDRGAAVRLELDASASPQIESLLTAALKLGPMDVYRQQAPLQPSDLMGLLDVEPRPELRVEPFVPAVPPVLRDVESLFGVVAERDILLHHPYESFDPVVRLLEEAAEDPDVLAIKQTLYRTSGDSPIARALSRAVENGKQVAVLVEIKARLDEANNIAWARKMEESGVHVVYGLIGLKTHAKVVLVVRREGNGIRRYVHLGTGNYNPHTARLYTDLSLFTSREEIADDVSALFNMLTGYAVAPQWKRLAVAPMGLQERVLSLIQREAEKARRGEPARIVAKMNSLVDATVIRALYAASQAGVDIDLLVRGICCLRPGGPGVSERIRVTSVVDRFLEHSRVFAFGAGANPEVWMSSADWMPRNFLRRVEVMFPVEDPAIRQRLLDEVLGVALADNVKARRLQVDGSYVPVGRNGHQVRSQSVLMERAKRNSHQDPKPLEALRHATAPDAPTPSRQVPQTSG
ncbi:polyphosphate kinase 1 [Archangium violaceum]|nr:polyphosphate kinase 1 [Archangium violaceum]